MPTHPPLHYCWHVLTLVSPLSPALLVLSSGLCSRLPSPRHQKLARGNCRATEMMTPAGVKNAVAAEPPSMERMTARRPTLMPKRAPSRRVVASNTGTKPKRRCLPCLSQRLRTWQSLICRSTNTAACTVPLSEAGNAAKSILSCCCKGSLPPGGMYGGPFFRSSALLHLASSPCVGRLENACYPPPSSMYVLASLLFRSTKKKGGGAANGCLL